MNKTEVLEHVGDALEHTIGSSIENGKLNAPELNLETWLEADPGIRESTGSGTWYKIPVRDGISGDGSEYHIYMRWGKSDHLCIFLSGGGMAWNTFTAARPVTGGKMAAKTPNYYWNNLRPATQFMNINIGITETLLNVNPFREWNFIVITYDTGDFHIGDRAYPYVNENGENEILYFHGWKNFCSSMALCTAAFPRPDRLLIAGDSAGAFAVPALAGTILEEFYPECKEITLLSDSATLIYHGWPEIVKDVWHAPSRFWKPLYSDDPAGDWYEAFANCYIRKTDTKDADVNNLTSGNYIRQDTGGVNAGNADADAGTLTFERKIRCLFSSSTHDHLLSTYYNDLNHKIYETNEEVQEMFYQQLSRQMKRLKTIFEADPEHSCKVFGMYIHQHRDYLRTRTGTVHTMIRHPAFLIPDKTGMSMAKWLHDAVEGNMYSIGDELLK